MATFTVRIVNLQTRLGGLNLLNFNPWNLTHEDHHCTFVLDFVISDHQARFLCHQGLIPEFQDSFRATLTINSPRFIEPLVCNYKELEEMMKARPHQITRLRENQFRVTIEDGFDTLYCHLKPES